MKKKSFNVYLNILLTIAYLISFGIFIYYKNNLGILMTIVSVIGLIVLNILNRRVTILIDNNLFVVLNLFLFFASLLGSGYDLYRINHYDDFLHIWSGFIAVAAGFNIFKYLNKSRETSKLLLIIYLIAFGLAIGSVWEIYEFLSDTLLKTNMQVGGLLDTMMDMIDGFIGTSIMTVILYIKGDLCIRNKND